MAALRTLLGRLFVDLTAHTPPVNMLTTKQKLW